MTSAGGDQFDQHATRTLLLFRLGLFFVFLVIERTHSFSFCFVSSDRRHLLQMRPLRSQTAETMVAHWAASTRRFDCDADDDGPTRLEELDEANC